MKFPNRIKWLVAVSVLAVGIPAAGVAFASPAEHQNTPPPAMTQQANQGSAPAAVPVHQPGTHNPADSQQHQAQVSNPAANQQQTQAPAPAAATPAPQVKMTPVGNSSGHGYHYGHIGPNDKMEYSYKQNGYGHNNHGAGGHE